MSKITFFEKTGCVNNTKQKQILALFGYEVEAVDLIKYDWTKDEILAFLGELPPNEWFNTKAPDITSGKIDPSTFTKETALEALLNKHILIRRPLLDIEGSKLAGFDIDKINSAVLKAKKKTQIISELLGQNLEDCPKKQTSAVCG